MKEEIKEGIEIGGMIGIPCFLIFAGMGAGIALAIYLIKMALSN